MSADMVGSPPRSNQRASRLSSSAANGSSLRPIHPEYVVEILRVIAVGMHDRTGDVYPGQPSRDYLNTRFFKHLSNRTVRWVLARFDDPGHRCPRLVVGPLHQQHLLIADDDGGDAGNHTGACPMCRRSSTMNSGIGIAPCLTETPIRTRATDQKKLA